MAKVIAYKGFSEGVNVLVRKYEKYFGDKLTMNDVCIIVKNTDKAVLFKIDDSWEVDNENAGKQFWVAKRALYMLEGERKVVYIKQWVDVNLV